MFDHWLMLGGNEIISTARAAAYARNMGITAVQCGACMDVTRALGDAPYTLPAVDDAPWYDPAVPASAQFAGVAGLGLEGIGNGTGARQSVALIGDGSALAPVRRDAREIKASTLLLAATDAGLSYGLAWLASALRGSVCLGSCSADELCLFAYCPTCNTAPPADPTTDTCGDDARRRLFNTGLLAGPTVTASYSIGGGHLAEVGFSLTAGLPYLYREPVYVTGLAMPSTAIPGYTPLSSGDCNQLVNCATDPACAAPAAPVRPVALADPCFTGPPPAGDTARTMLTQPAGLLPQWLEKVPLINLQTGDKALRALTIRWYGNPAGYDCAQYVDPCGACAEINIPYLPRNVTLHLDGRVGRAWIDCAGGPGLAQADVEMYGPGGSLFDWPVFECDSGLCLEVIAQASTVAANAWLDVSMAAREDAA